MNKIHFSLKLNSHIEKGREAVEKIQNFIRSHYSYIDENDVMDLRLIFSELVYNAIIHGNKHDAEKSICVEIALSHDGYITAVIKDEGEGYNYTKLLEGMGAYENTDYCSGSENGRGILLVKSLSDSISFNKIGNEVTFSKKVALKNAQYNNS